MQDLYLTSKIPPSVNHYLSYRAIMKNGKPMAASYKPPEVVKYRKEFTQYVKDECEKQGWDYIHDGLHHFYVDATFYMPRIDMDANNYWKVMLDAITDTQLVWKDDNVVCERVNSIYYDSNDPRVELHIYPTDYVGLFDNASHLEQFQHRCIGCSRSKRNCSILKKAKAGKVTPDVIDGVCQKYKTKNKGEI